MKRRDVGPSRTQAEASPFGGLSRREARRAGGVVKEGGRRRRPQRVCRRSSRPTRAADLAVGPDGIAVGATGSPQGASPRQGPELPCPSADAGAGVEDSERTGGFDFFGPQQQAVPRHRVPQQQDRAWPPASSPFEPAAKAGPLAPAQASATAARIVMTWRSRRGFAGTDRMGMGV